MSKTESLFILLLAFAFASCSAKLVPIEPDRMAEILHLCESKQYDAAITQLEPLLEKHPTDVEGHYILIRCYAEKQQLEVLEVVESRYKQAVEKHPRTAALWFALGYIYYQQGIQQKDQAKFQEAVKTLEHALKITQEIGDQEGKAICLYNIGDVYKYLSNYPKALEYCQQSLKIVKEIGDREDEAFLLYSIGSVYTSLDDYSKALESYQQTLKIAKEIGDREGEAFCLISIGLVYESLGDYPKALEYHQQALKITQEISGRESKSLPLGGIGRVYGYLGDYPKALEYYQQALSIAKGIGDREGESSHLDGIGDVYKSLGDYPKALEYYQQALEITQEIGDRKGETFRLRNIGGVYKSLGDYPKALEYYQQALSIAKGIGDREDEFRHLDGIGGVYQSLGDYPKALEYYQQALSIAKEIGYQIGEEFALSGIGYVYLSTGDYPKALEYYQQALNITQKVGFRAGEISVLISKGVIYGMLKEPKEYPQGFDCLNQALQLNREIGIQPTESKILFLLGATHLVALENFEQALQYLQAGLQLAQTLGISDFTWRCQFVIGSIIELQGKHEEAITSYKQAVETIESMRGKLQTKEMQASFMLVGNKTEVYERLIKLLIELGRNEEALEYLERSKSEILREALGRVKPRVKDEKVRGILEELERSENKLDTTASRLVEAKSKEEVEILTKLLAETKGQVSLVMWDLEQNYPETYQFLAANYKTFNDIQQRIPPDTLLVEYCVLPEEVYIFLITRNTFTLKSVKVNREQLNAWVLAYREGIQYLDDVSELSSKLYRILIGPIEAEIATVKTVTIVPYGLLYYLPFHALERTTEAGERQFFIQWKRISYLNTSSLEDFGKPIEAPANTPARPLVAFGNPDGTLEGALKEVTEIKNIIPGATIYVLDAAQKQIFLETAGEYKRVHLASHFQVATYPKPSYLILAPKDTGNLTVREIAGLVELFRKHHSIVVLSACNTAVEEMRKDHREGKAVMSLADAFARAGCPTLIASLWEVSDESTQQLMTTFYRAHNDGQEDILDALRQAQLKVLQTEGWDDEAGAYFSYAHPRYWAPFILIGEW